MPAWVEHAIFWHVYPLGFVGAEIRPASPPPLAHRLRRLIGWLDYAVELGASALLLGPIFASTSHGYDPIDHLGIDPRLGDEKDFDALIDEARRRDLAVVLDGVFNHVSRRHPLVDEFRALGDKAPRASWLKRGAAGLETFEGHHGLVALDHDEPAVADYVVDVMTHWLDHGAAGWRLDAAYTVAPKFWARVLPRVRARHPETYVFGELMHGDYVDFVARSGVDSVTQYELWKAIWSSIHDCNFFELAWALERQDRFLEHFGPQTFVGNHDVTRLATRLTDPLGPQLALVLLATLGGAPSIYAGDEQGFVGVKEHRLGGDDAIRPEFPASPADLPARGWEVYRRHQDLLGLRRRHPWLHRARVRVKHLANERIVYEVADGGDRLAVALDLAGGVEMPAPGMRAILGGRAVLTRGEGGTASIRLSGPGYAILSPDGD